MYILRQFNIKLTTWDVPRLVIKYLNIQNESRNSWDFLPLREIIHNNIFFFKATQSFSDF